MSTTNGLDSVAVFWDYENCPAPSNASGYAIANNICALARPFGVVKLFKAYLEISDQLRSITVRSELQSSGVSLVDCPHNGRKEVADKMLLVDMLAYAIDNPAPSTIILITGDRDFAYALSILKHRRYQVVLVTLSNAHASLVHQACIRFDWYNDVINQLDASNSQVSKESRYLLANDVYESDYLYSPKEVETVVYPTRNTRGTHSPSKNSRNIPLQSSLSSRLSTSQYRLNESNMRYAEDQTTMDVSSPSKPNRPRDRLPRFPTIEDSQDQERDRFIPSSNKSLIGRIEHTPSSPSSRTSSPFASVENESDHELKRKKPMIIPTMYVFLVRILQGHRRKGITHSYRSVIASKMAHEQATYRRAGVNTFAEFMELADRNGIVELGGNGKDAWVRLLSDWYDAVPF